MEMIWVWLAVVAVSLIVEFVSWDLTSIWFAISGLISLILSAIDGICWEVQLAVFIVISALLLIFVRKICRKFLLRNANTKTNVDAYVGKRAKLLKAIGSDEDYGEIKFNGVIWQAKSETDEQIEAGAEIEVVRVEGNKMIVKLANAQNSEVEHNDAQDKEIQQIDESANAEVSTENTGAKKTTKKSKENQEENK